MYAYVIKHSKRVLNVHIYILIKCMAFATMFDSQGTFYT